MVVLEMLGRSCDIPAISATIAASRCHRSYVRSPENGGLHGSRSFGLGRLGIARAAGTDDQSPGGELTTMDALYEGTRMRAAVSGETERLVVRRSPSSPALQLPPDEEGEGMKTNESE